MTWMRKKKNIIVVVVASVMIVVALFSLIWGILHHSEKTLLEVCWNNNQAEYVGETEMKSIPCLGTPEELVYPQKQIPLTVTTLSYDNHPLASEHRDSKVIAEAVDTVNSQFGFELTKMVHGAEAVKGDGQIKASVIVHTQTPYTPGSRALSSKVPGWVVHSRRPDGSIQCDVYIRGGLSERFMYRVAVHELGHAIGFAHDDFRGSVMYPLTADDTESKQMLPSRFTDTDCGKGRDLYLTKG